MVFCSLKRKEHLFILSCMQQKIQSCSIGKNEPGWTDDGRTVWNTAIFTFSLSFSPACHNIFSIPFVYGNAASSSSSSSFYFFFSVLNSVRTHCRVDRIPMCNDVDGVVVVGCKKEGLLFLFSLLRSTFRIKKLDSRFLDRHRIRGSLFAWILDPSWSGR